MNHIPTTDPYPWPYDGDLSSCRLALVLCGVQHHWTSRSADADLVISRLVEFAAELRRRGAVVVAVRHGRRPGGAGAGAPAGRGTLPVVGEPGWELAIDPATVDLVVDAAGIDGIYGSSLEHDLRAIGRDHLLLGGLAAEACVDSTLRSLNDRGFECLVLADGCAPFDPGTGARALSSVTMSGGIFGAVGTIIATRTALRGEAA